MFIGSKKIILYLLFAYIIFQFLWWELLLVKLEHQIIEKQKQVSALKITQTEAFKAIEKQLNQEQKMKIIMIVGEGTVFLILILFGFYSVIKAYSKEMALNRRQTHFLLSLPHELKTPLSVVQLNLQTILQNQNTDSGLKNTLIKKSLDELKRLNDIINQLLISNRIANSKYMLSAQKINMSMHLREWIKFYAEQKKMEENIQEDIFIYGDLYLIQLMIENLMSNAIKFSNQYVGINLRQEKNKVVLEIINDGEIIQESEKEKIFELFYRSAVSDLKGISGTGFGLYIVKQIVELHKVSINVITKSNYNVFQVVF